ncbi:response regulator [Niveispirillum sp.]|uniref:response regulator n=1 Tax=Niveispirillum sp. TaxID=1917217 RepID=UPI001B4D255A|nr:response regulator [Niveispirillum sp.]MBP7334876.1 hypothetical protein [Niveispirillum sp.]
MAMNRRGIEPHLARLRRHARAMAGNQASGDSYVSALLDIVRADPLFLETLPDPAVGLFKLYSRLVAATSGKAGIRQQRIRQALLLISMERFTLGDAAEIMGITPVEVEALVEAAGHSLASLSGAEVMIIESEPLIAMNIEQIVKGLGLRVNSMPPTHARAVTLLRRDRPDLIIADGGCHPGMVEDLYTSSKPPVVFISAFPEMLLTGSRPEPVFVARKPFDPPEIKALIHQALFFAAGH